MAGPSHLVHVRVGPFNLQSLRIPNVLGSFHLRFLAIRLSNAFHYSVNLTKNGAVVGAQLQASVFASEVIPDALYFKASNLLLLRSQPSPALCQRPPRMLMMRPRCIPFVGPEDLGTRVSAKRSVQFPTASLVQFRLLPVYPSRVG